MKQSTVVRLNQKKLGYKSLKCVHASSNASHCGEVAAVAAHRLDDEHAALRAGGALLDAVAELRSTRAHDSLSEKKTVHLQTCRERVFSTEYEYIRW